MQMKMKMRTLLALMLCAAALTTSCQKGGVGNVALKTETDTLSYAFGVFYGNVFKENNLKEVNFAAFAKGAHDGFNLDTTKFNRETAMEFINNYFMREADRKAQENLQKGQKFLQENSTKEGVVVDSTGLQYKVITEGAGARPTATDVVRVHYHGTLIDGTVFDSSVERGEPTSFQLNRVIQGWTIGVQKMPVGSKYIFYIPSELAYGTNVRPGGPIGPNETLIFEVELLGIEPAK